MANKYGNRKVITEDGEVFDSRREALRYRDLKFLESCGAISDLKRQVALFPRHQDKGRIISAKEGTLFLSFIFLWGVGIT